MIAGRSPFTGEPTRGDVERRWGGGGREDLSAKCGDDDSNIKDNGSVKCRSLYGGTGEGDWAPVSPSGLSVDERYKLCMSVGEEVLQSCELRSMLEKRENFICYDGFEPSGRMHIAQGIIKTINVNRLLKSGGVFVFWVADWFANLNGKMGGDMDKIRKLGLYFIEIWKSCGMDLKGVRFLWASEEINRNPDGYWSRVMDITKKFSITRLKRCGQIMGRSEGDDQPAAHILYPAMQCSDIFFLQADVCQLGMDQRKVNVLAREYCDLANIKTKPIILSHPMLPSLTGKDKMSKSEPESAIFMDDDTQTVNRKIKKAFCPPTSADNPCISYVTNIVLPSLGVLEVPRSDANGGNTAYTDENTLTQDFDSGALHPGDLKNALAKSINQIIQPVREHFNTNQYAKQLIQEIKSWET